MSHLKTNVLLSKMTWFEAKERLKETDIVLMPIGAFEQHGLHLPLDTDTFIALEISKRAAEKVARDVKAVVGPSIQFGISPYMMGFPGSITIQGETFVNLLHDVCESLIHQGFSKIVFVNQHYSNTPYIRMVIDKLQYERPKSFLALVNLGELTGDVISEVKETLCFHACETETSYAMALGQDIRMKKRTKKFPKSPIPKFIKFGIEMEVKPPFVITAVPAIDQVSKTGVIGDATKASMVKGKKMVEASVERLSEFLRELKKLDLQKSPRT